MSGINPHPDAIQAFEDLKLRNIAKFIVFRVNDDKTNVVVTHVSKPEDTFEDLEKLLLPNECCYVIYDYEYTSEESETPLKRIILISWSPDDARAREKMTYSATLQHFKCALSGVSVTIQATDFSELDRDDILFRCRRGY